MWNRKTIQRKLILRAILQESIGHMEECISVSRSFYIIAYCERRMHIDAIALELLNDELREIFAQGMVV